MTYITGAETNYKFTSEDISTPIYTQFLLQDRGYYITSWSVSSLDLVLGLIGGFVGLIWDILGFSCSGYESF